MLTEIEVVIPPSLAESDIAVPSGLSARLEDATRAIAALDAAHGAVLGGLRALLLRTEAVASSRIERIDASIDDYARAFHGSRANEAATSMVAATRALDALLTRAETDGAVRVPALLEAHRILLAGEPAERAYAGRLRDMQNWVGGSDHSPRGALLVPPPPELVPALLDDLASFTARTDVPALLAASIGHAQFETIHPFTDGNGRIGRALVNAVLRARGVTSFVALPIASALIARRDAYFAALDAFRDGEAEVLCLQFAVAATIAAEESAMTAHRLRGLVAEWRQALGDGRLGPVSMSLLGSLVEHPVLTTQEAEALSRGSSSAAYAAVERFEAAGILRGLDDRKRDRVFGVTDVLGELQDLDARIQARARLELPVA